jgi:hypothetical protein
VAPYLFKHGDRRGAADLLVTNVPGFVGGHFGGAAEYERGGRKDLRAGPGFARRMLSGL